MSSGTHLRSGVLGSFSLRECTFLAPDTENFPRPTSCARGAYPLVQIVTYSDRLLRDSGF